jgi:hypothetical protein
MDIICMNFLKLHLFRLAVRLSEHNILKCCSLKCSVAQLWNYSCRNRPYLVGDLMQHLHFEVSDCILFWEINATLARK